MIVTVPKPIRPSETYSGWRSRTATPMNRKLEPQIRASATKPGTHARAPVARRLVAGDGLPGAVVSGVAAVVTPDTLPQGYDNVASLSRPS
jgi:hypothetical protein